MPIARHFEVIDDFESLSSRPQIEKYVGKRVTILSLVTGLTYEVGHHVVEKSKNAEGGILHSIDGQQHVFVSSTGEKMVGYSGTRGSQQIEGLLLSMRTVTYRFRKTLKTSFELVVKTDKGIQTFSLKDEDEKLTLFYSDD